MTTFCPGCESPLTLAAEPTLNEIVECADCRAELEVIAADPLLLALAPEIEEDWGE